MKVQTLCGKREERRQMGFKAGKCVYPRFRALALGINSALLRTRSKARGWRVGISVGTRGLSWSTLRNHSLGCSWCLRLAGPNIPGGDVASELGSLRLPGLIQGHAKAVPGLIQDRARTMPRLIQGRARALPRLCQG